MNAKYVLLLGALALTPLAHAGDSTLDAAIGGGIGAAVGNEVGGREGAIVGGALGAAIGTSGSDNQEQRRVAPQHEYRNRYRTREGTPPRIHCPPGQAKKGRC